MLGKSLYRITRAMHIIFVVKCTKRQGASFNSIDLVTKTSIAELRGPVIE